MKTNDLIRVLLIEDELAQSYLFRHMLSESEAPQFEVLWTEELRAGIEALHAGRADVVVLDLSLPDCAGAETFSRLRGLFPKLPVVVLTGLDDDALGFAIIQAGAQDYLIKGQVTGPLLSRALRYAIERKRAEEEKQDLISQLQESLANVKTLKELLPICASCRKIRDDKGYWDKIENYLLTHTDVRFSHGLCPECLVRYASEAALPPGPPQPPS
jgi:DNA-binding NarL/FixJ family response regulator